MIEITNADDRRECFIPHRGKNRPHDADRKNWGGA